MAQSVRVQLIENGDTFTAASVEPGLWLWCTARTPAAALASFKGGLYLSHGRAVADLTLVVRRA